MKKYGVILADPPWQYRVKNKSGVAENHYHTMSAGELGALPIQDMAADDSVLLLWCTWPQLEVGMKLIDAWGFKYITGMPWVKIQGLPQVDLFGDLRIKPAWGIGFWIRGATEPILICRKGKAKPPDFDWVGLICERMQHSRKPDNLHEYAETLPGPYLELFARRRRPGWDAWGNEVDSDIVLTPAADGRIILGGR